MVMMEDRWLSTDEVADYLNIKKGTVYKWIGTRNIPAHRFGNVWKFRKKEVGSWMCSVDAPESRENYVSSGRHLCKMTLRDAPHPDASLSIEWSLWPFGKSLGKC